MQSGEVDEIKILICIEEILLSSGSCVLNVVSQLRFFLFLFHAFETTICSSVDVVFNASFDINRDCKVFEWGFDESLNINPLSDVIEKRTGDQLRVGVATRGVQPLN